MRTLATSLIGLSLVLGCRSVPATIELVDDQPKPAPEVFVEAQSSALAEDSAGPISAEHASLYACWFEHPYPYMFEQRGPPLELDSGSFGMFIAGIHGILYYGHLNECAGRLTGTEPRNYADIAPLEALAGVPATQPNANLPFAAVNPAFVDWARAELLPPGDQLILGLPAALAYERVFSRFFRAMATSAVWLAEHRMLRAEADTYLRAVEAGDDGLDWLDQSYGQLPVDGFADGTTMSGPMAAGFWLRRELDGSLPSCWHALVDVMFRYDRAWFDELRAEYPRGATTLSMSADPGRVPRPREAP